MKVDRRDFLTGSAALLATGAPVYAAEPGIGVGPGIGVENSSVEARFGPKIAASGKKGLVVTGHPLTSRVAVDVLREGGNACDALLAAALAQTVVEPHLSTITGCFSMLYHDAASGRTRHLNGNVNAPVGLPGSLGAADIPTARMVAVPGFWAGVEAAFGAYASLPMKRLMAPAVAFAREGFDIYPFLWGEIFARQGSIGRTPEGREIFMDGNVLPAPTGRLVQRRAAATLERLASEGSDYFYRGEFARKFADVVGAAGGFVTADDFAAYEVRWDDPVRGRYRGHDLVCAAPPDMGGVHLIEALNMVERLDLQRQGPPTVSVDTLYDMMLICREVLNNGARYGDPRDFSLPIETILSKDYAAMRLELLKTGAPAEQSQPAAPPGSCHLTVVDAQGNIATALHSTLSLPWVNGLFVEGVSICGAGVHFLRQMPRPGGRVAVMICPNIIFRNGRPIMASGSPSTSLVPAIVQNVTNILDFGMGVEESVRAPRFGGISESGSGAMWIEADFEGRLLDALREKGMALDVVNPWSFVQGSFEGIVIDANGMATGCGDPRRTSSAMAV